MEGTKNGLEIALDAKREQRGRESFQTVIARNLRGGGIASYTAYPAKWQVRRVGSPPNSTV